MDTQMKRGFLDACVLAAMAQGESYGYQIIKDVPASIGISESTLYPLLKRLESRKLIKVRKAEYNGRLRKYYSLTEAGRAFLAEFANDKREIDEVFDFVERATRGA
ncbi:PadR family transcriptional regulator [Parvibacter caecicola]|nr:PadR family transcriptional regulator [Parvibacter caecicola]